MRLSPFPPDADRPWRGVWILAWHGIREHLRSVWFWLSLIVLPVIFVGVGLGSGRDAIREAERRHAPGNVEGHLAVVVPGAALRGHVVAIDADGDPVDVLDAPPAADAPFAAVLVLDGADVRAITPRLEVRDVERRAWAVAWADHLWTRARAHALLSPEALVKGGMVDDAEEQGEAPLTATEVTTAAAKVAPVAIGMIVLLGALTGFSAGGVLSKNREKALSAVLRVGTPAAVLFLGGLLEAAVLALLRFLPYLALFVPLLVLAAVLVVGRAALGWLAALVLLGALGGLLAYLTAAGVGVLLDAVARNGAEPVKAAGGLLPLLAMPLVFGLTELPDGTAFAGIAPLAAVPLVGLPVLAKGVVLGRGVGWGVVGTALAAVGALASVRAGSWAYAREELRWSDVRRALVGGGR